ncbi:hypothetical protein GCM10018785_05360 [Streptomyces longispororuber]|uniref:Uncharacterized protein n=1 Tax=Streptomyces longispororuber TaxID=68230 RepID=A0A918Z727_9ACTN|nr:hypothetical protein [Streptomyces longispororuber]GHE38745.1 hypothetical protein GCM10018785_05360 [Streptomyces longispororuber]
MADVVDADELLRRIQAARDWAAREEQQLDAAARAAADETDGLGLTIRSAAFEAVRLVLDEIIQPGTHRNSD